MTPREKADELRLLVIDEMPALKNNTVLEIFDYSNKGALIVVNQILKTGLLDEGANFDNDQQTLDFWIEVKKELSR